MLEELAGIFFSQIKCDVYEKMHDYRKKSIFLFCLIQYHDVLSLELLADKKSSSMAALE